MGWSDTSDRQNQAQKISAGLSGYRGRLRGANLDIDPTLTYGAGQVEKNIDNISGLAKTNLNATLGEDKALAGRQALARMTSQGGVSPTGGGSSVFNASMTGLDTGFGKAKAVGLADILGKTAEQKQKMMEYFDTMDRQKATENARMKLQQLLGEGSTFNTEAGMLGSYSDKTSWDDLMGGLSTIGGLGLSAYTGGLLGGAPSRLMTAQENYYNKKV